VAGAGFGVSLKFFSILRGQKEKEAIMKFHLSRREVLRTTTGVAAGSLAAKVIPLKPQPLFASAAAVAPSDRVRFGIVGVGLEGTNLLSTAIQLPGVECAGACDLYDGRHELAREIVG
jgi:hypothetical protein